MKISKRISRVVVAGLVASLTPLAFAPSANAAAPSWEPDINSAGGTITFYDSAGNVVTSGSSLSHLADYAVASSAGRDGATKASLSFAKPDHSITDPAGWFAGGASTATNFPVGSAPAPINTSTNPVASLNASAANLASFIGTVDSPDTSSGYKDIWQLRLKDSGPGLLTATTYWTADVLVDQNAGTWQQVYPVPLTISVGANPASPQSTGTNVTFTATLSGASTGSVQFKDDGSALGAAQAVSSGTTASVSSNALSVGSHSISATFTPSSGPAINAPAITYVIAPPTPTIAVTALPASPQVLGTSVTFTGTLASAATGSVQFKDGANNLGSPVTVTNATTAPLATSALTLGTHSITAVFTPSSGSATTSPAISYVIIAPTATVTVGATPASPQVQGTNVTFTATLSTASTGTVQFKDGNTDLGSAQTVTNATTASVSTTSLSAATHTITAVFTPQGNIASTSPNFSYTINPGSAITLTADKTSPQTLNTSITFTATLNPAGTGTVIFKDGNTNISSPVTVNNGVATYPFSGLGVGSHSLTAVYTPTAGSPSTSNTLAYTISDGPTAIVIGSNPVSPVTQGTNVTFTASISGTPSAGTVQFKDGDTNLGSPVTVASGAASMTTNALTVGSHSISAVFTPTSVNTPVPSQVLPFVINAAQPATVALAASPGSSAAVGATVTFTATLTPTTVAGTVQFKDGPDNLGSAVAPTSGVATLATSALAVGGHSITATFTPTGGGNAASSPVLSYVINPTGTLGVTVAASPASPAVAGTTVTFTATLAATSTGTVQFKDGESSLGAAQSVSNGTTASVATAALSVGNHSVSAVFTPSGGAATTSPAITYTITAAGGKKPVGEASLDIGSHRVGAPDTCVSYFDVDDESELDAIDTSYSWAHNGIPISGAHDYKYVINERYVGQKLTCTVVATNAAGSTTFTSDGANIGPGTALKALGGQGVAGSLRAGSVATCRHGNWSRLYQGFTFQWYIGGRKYGPASSSDKLRLSPAWVGKTIECVITAHRAGWQDGRYVTAKRMITA